MRLFLRFGIPLLGVLAIMAAALTPLVDSLIDSWQKHDLEIRSRLVFNSIEGSLPSLLTAAPRREMTRLFNRLAENEHILAAGWCNPSGVLETSSEDWPQQIKCLPINTDPSLFRTERWDRGRILYAGFSTVSASRQLGQLLS